MVFCRVFGAGRRVFGGIMQEGRTCRNQLFVGGQEQRKLAGYGNKRRGYLRCVATLCDQRTVGVTVRFFFSSVETSTVGGVLMVRMVVKDVTQASVFGAPAMLNKQEV